jgi:hypothetical protein
MGQPITYPLLGGAPGWVRAPAVTHPALQAPLPRRRLSRSCDGLGEQQHPNRVQVFSGVLTSLLVLLERLIVTGWMVKMAVVRHFLH